MSVELNPQIKYAASSSLGKGMDVSNVVVLFNIPLFMWLMGVPNNDFAIQQLYCRRYESRVFGGIPVMEQIRIVMQANHGEKPYLNKSIHYEYNAMLNKVEWFIQEKSMLWSTTNLQNGHHADAIHTLQKAREVRAITPLNTLSSAGPMPDPRTDSDVRGFRNGRDMCGFLDGHMSEYWKRTRNQIDVSVWHPDDLKLYEANYKINMCNGHHQASLTQPSRVRQLLGFTSIRAVTSDLIPRGNVYFFCSKYAFMVECPQTIKSWINEGRDGVAMTYCDQVCFTILNPSNAGFKFVINGIPAENEVKTMDDARVLMKHNQSIPNNQYGGTALAY